MTTRDCNTAALRSYMKRTDEAEKSAAALYDLAEAACDDEVEEILSNPDAMTLAIYEADMDLCKGLAQALHEASEGDCGKAIRLLREARGKVKKSLFDGLIETYEAKVAADAEEGLTP